LKLTFKKVSVKKRRIKATFTHEMIEDLSSMSHDINKQFSNEMIRILQEEEREIKRKERKEKIKKIFEDGVD
jgi:archaellum biogenesis ATPase FlaH